MARPLSTHCKYGHPYDKDNTGFTAGRRYCLACNRARVQRYQTKGDPALQSILASEYNAMRADLEVKYGPSLDGITEEESATLANLWSRLST